MNYRERFTQILDFLKPYQRIWQNEIMLMYPNPLEGYPEAWLDDLGRFNEKKYLIRIEKREVFDYIESPSLITFYQKIEELTTLPKIPSYPPMPEDPFTYLFMIPKKQHEIKRLAPVVNELYQKHQIKTVLDIGGGVGLLAQTFVNQYNLNVTSVDQDPVMQETGRKRHEKNARSDKRIYFKNLKVSSTDEFHSLLKDQVMPVGLHTCGKLALDIIRSSSLMKTPALINFGCCYQNLDTNFELHNISKFAQESGPLELNRFALTLACRAHKKISDKDFDLKHKVKLYRYAIHILLYDHYDMKKPVTLGNSSPKLYDRPFSEYALEQFKRIGVSPKHSASELDQFLADSKINTLILKMITAGIIRNALGRVLELYLLLDRAIYLEEQGLRVRLEEFFEEEISPRNIGIIAESSLI